MNNNDSAKTIETCETQLSARNIAMGAGELSVAVRREVARIMIQQHGHQLSALKVGVNELLERGLIESGEVQDLNLICELVFPGSERKKIGSQAAAAKIQELFQKMSINSNCSPVALAVASVANKAFVTDGSQDSPAASSARRISPE